MIDDNSPKKPTLTEIMIKMKPLFLLVLLFPVIGMIIAGVLIYMTKPNNMEIILSAICFLILIYSGTIFYISKKIDALKTSNKS